MRERIHPLACPARGFRDFHSSRQRAPFLIASFHDKKRTSSGTRDSSCGRCGPRQSSLHGSSEPLVPGGLDAHRHWPQRLVPTLLDLRDQHLLLKKELIAYCFFIRRPHGDASAAKRKTRFDRDACARDRLKRNPKGQRRGGTRSASNLLPPAKGVTERSSGASPG